MRTAFVALALAVGLLDVFAPLSASNHPTGITLERLIAEADSIFLGTVEEIPAAYQDSSLGGLPTRIVRYEPSKVLKGAHAPGVPFTARQSQHSSPFRPGEVVLLYMRDEQKHVFAEPVGYFGGDFRRASSVKDPEAFYRNLSGNAGLWHGPSLWNTTTFKRVLADEFLKKHLAVTEPDLLKDPEVFSAKREEILSYGDAPSQAKSLPLEFILAATYARLHNTW